MYRTIGLTGIDLLLLNEDLKIEFMDRLSRLRNEDVFCITTDLQLNSNVLREMIKQGILVRDENSQEFKELQEIVNDYENLYVNKTGSIFDDFDLGIEEAPVENLTSEFSDFDDNMILDELVENVKSHDLTINEELKETEGELLQKHIDQLADTLPSDSSLVQFNMLRSIIQRFKELPIRFRESAPEGSEPADEYTRKLVCLIAQNIWKARDILSEIYMYKNRLITTVGLPVNCKYSSRYGIVSLVNYADKLITSSGRQDVATTTGFQIINMLDGVKQTQKSIARDKEAEEALLIDLNFIFSYKSLKGNAPSKAERIIADKELFKNLMFYYRFYYDIYKTKIQKVFDNNQQRYKANEKLIATRILRDYGILGILPNQSSEIIRNYAILSGDSKQQSASLSDKDITVLRIIRNALLSEDKFASRR